MRKIMFNLKRVAHAPGAAGFLGGYWDVPQVTQKVRAVNEEYNGADDSLGARVVDVRMLELGKPKLE